MKFQRNWSPHIKTKYRSYIDDYFAETFIYIGQVIIFKYLKLENCRKFPR